MKQAMIFAAGLGTRLRPLTNTMPKALVPVAGRPLLHHAILRLKAAGFERIVVNVHHFGQQIIDDLQANGHFGLDIRISDERDLLLDTGGGLRHAAPLFEADSPILIHNVDILSDADLNSLYATQADATLLVSPRPSSRLLLFHPLSLRLQGWQNTKTGEVRGLLTTFARAFAGIHLFSPRLFPLMQAWPERFSIIDFYLNICASRAICAVDQPRLRLMDVGKLDTLADADAFAATLTDQYGNTSI